MSVADAYATAQEYRDRVTKSDAGDDADILEQLTGVSRLIDVRTRRFFSSDAAPAARIYSGNGRSVIWVDDIATVTGLVVKYDTAGNYDPANGTVLDIDVDFWVGPYNSDKGPEVEPFQWLEIHPNSTNLAVWTHRTRALEVTARFGWPAVPDIIREHTIDIVREVRDKQEAGSSLTLQNLEAEVERSQITRRLMKQIENAYGRPPGV